MINTHLFEAKEYDLILYNQKAVIDTAFRFYTVVGCFGYETEQIGFDFPDYESAYFNVYNERLGRLVISLPMTRNDDTLILNASQSDMTFEDNGYYYYEIGYLRNGYEQALRYGKLKVI